MPKSIKLSFHADLLRTLADLNARIFSLKVDCEMALTGTWDKSNDGFEAMKDSCLIMKALIREITKSANKYCRRHEQMRLVLQQLSEINLTADNCASLEVANRRIRNLVCPALRKIQS